MRIRMITLASGPEGVFQPGREYNAPGDMSQEKAQEMCEGGFAVPVKEERETAVSGAPETLAPFEIPGVSRAVVQEMAARGITLDNLAETPDQALKNVPGLGKAALEKIRAWCNEQKG